MTSEHSRRMALALPETEERAHQRHPDFRVRGKIFATLAYPDESFAMVKLTPEQQAEFLASEPGIFSPAAGAWGRKGCTYVRLAAATKSKLHRALVAAWCNAAPKALAQQFEAELKV